MNRFLPGDSDRREIVRRDAYQSSLGRPQYSDYSADDRPPEPASSGLLEYWRIFQRRKGTVVLVAFLGTLAGFLFTLPQTPIYQARTTIEIQGVNEDFMHMREMNPTADSSSGYYPDLDIQTQVRILQNRELLDRVTGKLDLDKRPLIANENRLSAWRNALGLAPPKPVNYREQAIAMAAGNLKVRSETNTRLIEISCDSTDPQLAAEFANRLTGEFIEQSLEARWQTTQHTGEWLTRQMEDVRIKLEKSEAQLQAYAGTAGLLYTAEKDNVAEIKLRQLQEELSKAQADRVAKQSRIELVSSASPESLAEVLDDPSLKDIQGKLTDLQRQYAELSSAYTRSHPKVKKIQAQIDILTGSLENARGNIVARMRNDFQSAQRREKLLAADYSNQVRLMAEQADNVNHYNILKREVDTNRQLYDNMLQRVKEAGIASALRASNIRVVESAVPPSGPYKPNVITNTAIGLLTGLFLGIAFVVFRERADRTIQEPGDASLYLGIPELGLVPSAAADPLHPRHLLGTGGASGSDLALVTRDLKRSAMSEAFRTTLTSILFSGEHGNHPHVLVISSSAPREGKTTLATNLAIALAEIHQRVLLIDADLRRPRLHRVFDVENGKGLADLLRLKEPVAAPLNGHVQRTEIPDLYVMPSGSSHEDDLSLFHSRRLAELVTLVRGEYDMVLIDTPPMLTMADARIIARHADGVIIVTRANQTSRESLKDACQRFQEDGTNVLGTVLNDWNPKKSTHYGYYRYYDKYRHYYSPDSKE
jgi:capsular exopolysaccharide synthesis family protein